ncbi:ABC transporter substrate-binding protein [Streptomyces graminilatus]|uniref:ABC transporter substrate-binding protein n=1 Tax=Streptomyces graminilatus TaxID=1464070 RepID=UPI0006E30977|nr:ABC transporter substrate-binding protein [Streptomyces graminilatus]
MRASRITAPGAALCIGLLTVSACSSGATGSAGGASGAFKLTTRTPAATGSLDEVTWNLPLGEPTTLDPAKVGDYSPNTVEANLCDPLLRLRPDYSIAPGLASSWKKPDDQTLVLELREDVKFWNGDPMTAKDVVASLTRQSAPATQAVNASVLASVKSVTATGDHQVTIRFKQPDELFLKSLVNGFGGVSEASYMKKAGASYGTAKGGLMCSGPFKLENWKSGDSITAVRNDQYWDASLRPKVKKLTFKFVTDSNTLTSALLSGQIDGSYEIPSSVARALRSSGAGKLYYGPSAQTNFIAPTTPSSPLADSRVAKALSLVLDQDALIKNVYDGAAGKLKTVIPPLVWKNGEAAAVYAQGYGRLPATPGTDEAKAKQLIAQAAPKKRSVIVAMPAGDQQSLQILTFLQAAAKTIGLDVVIKQLQPTQMSDVFYDAGLRKGLDGVIGLGYVEVPDPLSYVPLFTAPDGLFNWTGYKNAEVTSLLTRAQAATDPEKSAALFNQAQELYTKDLAIVPIAAPYERMFMNKRLSGAPSSFAYINMPWAAYLGGTGGAS